MKLLKLAFLFQAISFFVTTLFLWVSFTVNNVSSKDQISLHEIDMANTNFLFSSETDALKKHKKKARVGVLSKQSGGASAPAPVAPIAQNSTNNTETLNASVYKKLNQTYVKQEINLFKKQINTFDFKLIDKQVEDIFQTMKLNDEKAKTMHGDRIYMEIFINEFMKCDNNTDNELNLLEFKACMANDTYLSKIQTPPANVASRPELNNTDKFYEELFIVLNTHNTTSLNFHAYMELRLILFSWRKCSVAAPFIEEIIFECAIEVLSGMKTNSRTTLRNIFYMALELSGSETIRNLDFITFVYLGQSIRNYGKMNGKMDHELTKNEMNLALDENVLSYHYNQDLVDSFFSLVLDLSNPYAGLDLRTFVYLDFSFRLFGRYSKTKRWKMTALEFNQTIGDINFPTKIKSSIDKIPYTQPTQNSYQMYQYLNISEFNGEENFFVKFTETNSKKIQLRNSKSRQGILEAPTPLGYVKDPVKVATRIFNLLDINSDGFLESYDYGIFIQMGLIFGKCDVNNKGYILAGDAFDQFNNWSDYPRMSTKTKDFTKRLSQINQDKYINFYNILTLVRIDDIVSLYSRRSDPTTLNEIELKRVFMKCNLLNVSDSHLTKCLRGLDSKKVPKYDWECAFMTGLEENIDYEETAMFYNTMKNNNLNLTKTVFYNIDPALTVAAAPK